MDLEEAQEKGWSGVLVYHEIFNELRKYEIVVDEKVSHYFCAVRMLTLVCAVTGGLCVMYVSMLNLVLLLELAKPDV